MPTQKIGALITALVVTAACGDAVHLECDSLHCLASAYEQCRSALFVADGGAGGEARYRVAVDETQSPAQCQLSLTFSDNPNPTWNGMSLFFSPPAELDFETAVGQAVSECMSAQPAAIARFACSGPLLDIISDPPEGTPRVADSVDISQWSCGVSVDEEFAALFPMVDQNRRWGFVDRAGSWRISPHWDQVTPFSEGRAMVRDGQYWSLIDDVGGIVADDVARARSVGWSDELGGVSPIDEFSQGCAVFDDGSRLQLIDRSGVVWPLQDHPPLLANGGALSTISNFHYGLAAFRITLVGGQRELTGYMNAAGEVAIQPQFASGGPFGRTAAGTLLAPAAEFRSADSPFAGAPGYIDVDGRWVEHMHQLYRARPFVDGRALLQRERNAEWSVWDGVNEQAVEGKVETVLSDLHDGFALLTRGSFGRDLVVINADGRQTVALDDLSRCERTISDRYRHGLLALLVAVEGAECGDGNAGLHAFTYPNGTLVYLNQDGQIVRRQD